MRNGNSRLPRCGRAGGRLLNLPIEEWKRRAVVERLDFPPHLLNLPIEEWKPPPGGDPEGAGDLLNLPIEEWKLDGITSGEILRLLLNLPIKEWKHIYGEGETFREQSLESSY